MDSIQKLDTLPKYLVGNFLKWGDQEIAIRKKRYGIWNEYSWLDHYHYIKYFSLGLINMGMKKGDKVSIIGDTDPEWNWAQLAIMSAGGVVAGLFADSHPDEMKYIVEHSNSKFLVAHDQEQVDKALNIKDKTPLLSKVIYWEQKGMRNYEDPILIGFNDVIEKGKSYDKNNPNVFEDIVSAGSGNDIATICYTSGTTDLPKGAIITHKSLLKAMEGALEVFPAKKGDNIVAVMPPVWMGALMLESGHLLEGAVINYPEKPETAVEDLKEVSPYLFGGGPKIWEGMVSLIQSKINEAGILINMIYKFMLKIGYRLVDIDGEQKKKYRWKVINKLADMIIFSSLRKQLGFHKTRYYFTGFAAIGPETNRYFHAIGCPLRQIYGSTEAGAVCGHKANGCNINFDTVGSPLPGFKVQISSDGEILVGGEGLFSGYHKNMKPASEVMNEGWFRTGDAGYINEEGQLILIGRLSEINQIADGSKFSIDFIESSLRFSFYIKEAVVICRENSDYLYAIINIDYDNVGRWAEKERISYTTYTDLSQKKEVANLIIEEVRKTNRLLPKEMKIRKIALLHKEIDADEDELTRTKKLKRLPFEKRYKELIVGLYSNKKSVRVQTLVTYRDGRKSDIGIDIRIWEVLEP